MALSQITNNAVSLEKELQWFTKIVDTRFKLYFQQECEYSGLHEIPMPSLNADQSFYAEIINHYKMSMNERIVLILALIPHVRPHILDVFFAKNATYDRGFTEFGGLKGKQHSGFLPTGETAAFVLAGNDLKQRVELMQLFDDNHYFRKHNILKLDWEKDDEPQLSRALQISKEYLSYLTTGENYRPSYNSSFPASLITTQMDWSDLVVDHGVMGDIDEIRAWIKHGQSLLQDWGLGKKVKRGFRSLFFGPPGTGKTLTASLLGKTTGLDVYRIDLSMVVSKYIGETEKNLANIFDQAENKNWILFFDEADALFGKRTKTSDSKDRYANQEVSYLLQRIEDFPGLVILATNLKANLDDAFARRFQSMVYFSMPNPELRLKLWKNAFPERFVLDTRIDLKKMAQNHELSGGAIINITRYCTLMALSRSSQVIEEEDLLHGIRKEFLKEGKTVA